MAWQPREIMNQRTEFALKALQTDNFRVLCREYEISPKIGYKWLARFKEEGMGGMGDQSRRPRSSPESLGEEAICRIINSRNDNRYLGATEDPRGLPAAMGARAQ